MTQKKYLNRIKVVQSFPILDALQLCTRQAAIAVRKLFVYFVIRISDHQSVLESFNI